jgi:hypothetical protein
MDEEAFFDIVGRKGVRYFYHYRIWEAGKGEKLPRMTKVTKLKVQHRRQIGAHILNASAQAAGSVTGGDIEFEQVVHEWLKLRGSKLKPVLLDALTAELKAVLHKEGVAELIKSINSDHEGWRSLMDKASFSYRRIAFLWSFLP